MKVLSFLIGLVTTLEVYGATYVKVGPSYRDNQTHEIENVPNIRTQDGVGICYAATAAQLINFEYCKQNNLDCSDSQNQLSLLDITARYERMTKGIKTGGDVIALLENIKRNTKTIHKEHCLPFELLAHKRSRNAMDAQGAAYRKLESIFKKNPRNLSPAQQMCQAQEIKEMLPIQKDLAAILEAYHAENVAQFVYEVAIKDECKEYESKVELPNYQTKLYPTIRNRNKADEHSTLAKIEGLVLNNVPVSLSFCSSDYFIKGRPNTCAPHAVTIVGIKESCNAQSCKILFKVQNSYGQEWQDRNNDGWVEAMPLIKRARNYRTAGYMTWVTNDNKKLPNKKLTRTTLDQLTPDADRFPGNIDINRGPIFKCDTYYGDWKPNRACSFLKYRR